MFPHVICFGCQGVQCQICSSNFVNHVGFSGLNTFVLLFPLALLLPPTPRFWFVVNTISICKLLYILLLVESYKHIHRRILGYLTSMVQRKSTEFEIASSPRSVTLIDFLELQFSQLCLDIVTSGMIQKIAFIQEQRYLKPM